MPGRSRWRVAAGWQDPRGGRLPRQPQSPALPEQMAPGVSAGALLTLFSAWLGSRLPPAPPRGCGTAIPFASELRWLPRGHGHPAPRGRWLPATGAEGAGCARLGREGGYLMGAGCGRARTGQQCPASRVAILPRDAVLGFRERRQLPALEVPGAGEPLYGFSVPLRPCCPFLSPSLWCLVWKVPAGSQRALAPRVHRE